MTELVQSGRISILRFYERRARRLLPGLLVVMLASLPFAWKYLLPEQLVDFSKSLVFSLLFSSNFYWNFSLQQYGAESALLKPFLHTWTLAVEEQYYIVFPLFLFGIFKWGKQYLAWILLFILLPSLLFAQWMTERDASFSFYMLPTRFWELLAGSLLALVVLKNFELKSKLVWPRAMPTLGLLLIAVSFASFGLDVHHPGFITLVPVLGTVLIIYFKNDNDWVTRILSRPTVVYLGLLSYSLYLWHYPIFAFGRMAAIAPTAAHKVAWVILTLFLSMMSYHMVEKPFRSKRVSRRALVLGLFLASSVGISVSLYWIIGDGISSRGNYVQDLIRDNTNKIVRKDGMGCHSGSLGTRAFGVADSCVFEYFPGSPTLVLVGDSHAARIADPVRALAMENRLNFVQITHAGCPHLEAPGIRCEGRARALKSFLKRFRDPTIVYSARLQLYIEREPLHNREGSDESENKGKQKRLAASFPEDMANVVIETLTDWVDDGYGLVIVYPVPEQGFHVFPLLGWMSSSISGPHQLPTFSTSFDEYKERVASSYAALDRVSGSRVWRVYPENIFCREATGRCIASEFDRLYFATDGHVAKLGADLIVREVASVLGLKVPAIFRQ